LPDQARAEPVTASRIILHRDSNGPQFEPAAPASRALVSRARHDPHVRFIVGLAADISVEQALSFGPEAGDLLAEASHKAQQAFVERMAPHLRGGGPRHFEEIPGLPYVRVALGAAGVEALLRDPEVISINTESAGPPILDQSVPFSGAAAVHTGGNWGSGYTIAVIDSGVQKSHPMFNGKVVSEACYSAPTANYPALCANGLPHGSTATGSGEPCVSVLDCGPWHGSHVAGAALGKSVLTPAANTPGGQSLALSGVAPGAGLISIQAISISQSVADCIPNPAPCAVVKEGDLALALQRTYALRNSYPIAAVNISLVLTNDWERYAFGICDQAWPLVRDAVALLDRAGIAVIAGTGNVARDFRYAGKMAPPACLSRVTSVAATARNSYDFATYSNASGYLDLLGPGGLFPPDPVPASCSSSDDNFPAGVVSAYPLGGCRYLQRPGTSVAAPHVAGGAALLRSQYPDASPSAVRNQLRLRGVPVTVTQDGTPNIVRPAIALSAAVSNPPAAPSATGPLHSEPVCGGYYLMSWTAASGLLSGYYEYQLEGSTSSSFFNAARYYVGTATTASVGVSTTTYFRVRACNTVSCGTWRTTSIAPHNTCY
jgi:subtilisin